MTTSPAYDALVERLRREREGKETIGPDTNGITWVKTHIEQKPEMVGYITKSGRVLKSKPGRKLGSKKKKGRK